MTYQLSTVTRICAAHYHLTVLHPLGLYCLCFGAALLNPLFIAQILSTFEKDDYVFKMIQHFVITLVDLQLDAQNSCLFTYNTFIKILYMFRTLLCSSSGGLRRNCICVASGIVTLCR